MVGRVVCSAAGRDRGSFMVIVAEDREFLLVCDGKQRPVERPKRKNPKHLKFTNYCLETHQFETNRRLIKELKRYSGCIVEEET